MKNIAVSAIIFFQLSTGFSADMIDEIILSNNSEEMKKAKIAKIVNAKFIEGGVLPKLAERATLEKHFKIIHLQAFGGKLPFDLEVDHQLYVIQFLPESEGEHVGVYFSSFSTASEDDLLKVFSGASARQITIVKRQIYGYRITETPPEPGQ